MELMTLADVATLLLSFFLQPVASGALETPRKESFIAVISKIVRKYMENAELLQEAVKKKNNDFSILDLHKTINALFKLMTSEVTPRFLEFIV